MQSPTVVGNAAAMLDTETLHWQLLVNDDLLDSVRKFNTANASRAVTSAAASRTYSRAASSCCCAVSLSSRFALNLSDSLIANCEVLCSSCCSNDCRSSTVSGSGTVSIHVLLHLTPHQQRTVTGFYAVRCLKGRLTMVFVHSLQYCSSAWGSVGTHGGFWVFRGPRAWLS